MLFNASNEYSYFFSKFCPYAIGPFRSNMRSTIASHISLTLKKNSSILEILCKEKTKFLNKNKTVQHNTTLSARKKFSASVQNNVIAWSHVQFDTACNFTLKSFKTLQHAINASNYLSAKLGYLEFIHTGKSYLFFSCVIVQLIINKSS